MRTHSVLWISLALFVVLMRLLTGTSCVLASTIGLPCPGCGLTRAFADAWHGHWAEAFRMHPLFWLAPPVLLAMLILLAVKPAWLSSRWASRIWLAVGLLFILVYLVRMLLFFPDTEPLTYNHLSVVGRLLGLLGLWGG